MIDISESAQVSKGLIGKPRNGRNCYPDFRSSAGTPQAETCIAYCRPGEESKDTAVEYDGFRAWFEEKSIMYLEDAEVDYKSDEMGGQLTIKAPNARVAQVGPDASLEDRINYILQNEINPGLAAHGGVVSLVEVTEDMNAVLQFGGCQGCSAVDLTLKNGVEASLGAAARARWCDANWITVSSRTLTIAKESYIFAQHRAGN